MLKIIIIDDEPRHRKGLSRLIAKLRPDYEINQFKNGYEALEFVLENSVDIIITDIKMPIMDGLKFIESYNNQKQSKIIVLSGYANFEYAQNAISLGVFDYLLKPVDEEKILQMLIKVEKSIKDDQLKKNNEKLLVNSLNITKPAYIEWQFNRWIKGLISNQDLSEIKKYLTGQGEGRIIVTKLSIHGKITDFNSEDNDEILNSIKNWINEDLKPFGAVVSFYLHDYKNCLISAFEKDCEAFYKYDFQRFNEVIDIIKSGYGIDITIGISACCSNIYMKANKCFLEAMESTNLSFYLGEGNIIIFSDENHKRNCKTIVDSRVEELFNDSISGKSKLESIDIIHGILKSYLKNGYPEPNELKSSISRILINVINNVKNFMSHEDYNDFTVAIINKIDNSKYLIELEENCISINLEIIEIIKNWKGNKNQLLFEKCISYIDNHYMENISLENMAEIFYFNPCYFSSMFKEVMGVNFIKYLLKIRIKKSCELLLKTNKKVYEISFLVGYKDSKYFNRVFKSELKVSPEEYRHLSSSERL